MTQEIRNAARNAASKLAVVGYGYYLDWYTGSRYIYPQAVVTCYDPAGTVIGLYWSGSEWLPYAKI